jgi:PAS domain S-box-containing protein
MLYQALFEHALDGMLIANNDRVSVEANPAAAALLGLERQALIGRRIDDILAPEQAEAFAAVWDTFLENGTAQSAIWVRRPDGTRRRVEDTAKAHVQPGRHLAILRDVTERQTMIEA